MDSPPPPFPSPPDLEMPAVIRPHLHTSARFGRLSADFGSETPARLRPIRAKGPCGRSEFKMQKALRREGAAGNHDWLPSKEHKSGCKSDPSPGRLISRKEPVDQISRPQGDRVVAI